MMKITFLGATEEVTGSKYLIEHAQIKLLVDCGLFQGTIKQRNWDAFPIDPSSINAIVLTHAHIDHSGYIPALTKKGFKGTIYCSQATYELCVLVLRDSASVQEKNAEKSRTKPLYTLKDAEQALTLFQPIASEKPLNLDPSLTVTLIPSHHILGSSFAIVSNGKEKLTFSGDLGRADRYIMKEPTQLKQTDFLVLESTYGDRIHEPSDPLKNLATIIHDTMKKNGIILIPAFAVERTQEILYCLYQLKKTKAIPDIPVYLDSPLAIGVSNLFCTFIDEHTLSPELCKKIFNDVIYIHTVQESKNIDSLEHSAVVIAGSGMAEGGRILDHFKHFISQAKNTIVFVGFQAEGTHGHALTHGAKSITIDGRSYNVQANMRELKGFSAHADSNDILKWLSYFEHAPKKVFLTHGELEAAHALKKKIEERFGWSVIVPKYLESFELE